MLTIKEKDKTKSRTGSNYLPFLAFLFALFWMEMVIKLWDFETLWNRGLLYTSLFTLAISVLLAAICTVGSYQRNRPLSLVILGGFTLIYMVQAVYYTVMKTVFAVYSVSVASKATEFWRVGVLGVWNTLPILFALAIPFLLFLRFGKAFTPDHIFSWKRLIAGLLLGILLHGVALTTVFFSDNGIVSPGEIYYAKSNPELSLSNFGVLTSLRLDLRRILFPPKEAVPTVQPDAVEFAPPEGSVYAPNVQDIDFGRLSKNETDAELGEMHRYFASRTPTMQNEYTGMFEGKNLIMLTAEAFSSWAVDETLTPTLYRLSKEGFVCKNFYTPLWWVSTSDGEYVSCNSLIPKSGKQSFGVAATNSLPFCMGNQLRGEGYETKAYHNHTYTYYMRDKTHPNMGYDYKGLGSGLEVKPTWPESDLEMMHLSLPEYIGKAPFHTYYMTVSGHLEYNFTGNQMAYQHRDEVSNLPISEEAQAYLACQIELDRALEYILQELAEVGELDNTVICLYADHYPYGLSDKAIAELAGEDVTNSLELHRNTMILWSGDMEEPVVIDKPCSNLDILPTLSNLFGLSYDSRLLMGRDILSTDPGLVIFSDNSYITDLGTYTAKEDDFVSAPNANVPEGYARQMLRNVQDMFLYSGKVLLTDYYRKLGVEPPTAVE